MAGLLSPQVVARAPMTLELNVEYTLEPRVDFLRDSVGIAKDNIAKVQHGTPYLAASSRVQLGNCV